MAGTDHSLLSLGKQVNQFSPKFTLAELTVHAGNQAFVQRIDRFVEEFRNEGRYRLIALHGPVGSGKSHLLHALGHALTARHGEAKVLYLTIDSFINSLIEGVRSQCIDQLREFLDSLDLILLDYFHYLADKEKSQSEFQRLLRQVILSHRRLVVASYSDNDIPGVLRRIRFFPHFRHWERFEIRLPDRDGYRQILRRWIQQAGMDISEATQETLIDYSDNISLLGALWYRMQVESSHEQRAITPSFVEEVVNRIW